MPTILLQLPSSGRSPCRACGAKLDWYYTHPIGRAMPMNAGSVAVRLRGGGPNPEIGEFDAADSHWTTCPERDRFRKDRQ